MNRWFKPLIVLLLLSGIFFRLWHLDFGLPHSWYADEPEIGEPAIMYTYEIKNIIRNNDIYKLIPQSYVYGTLPVYAYTIFLMIFSKALNLLNIGFSKMDLYVYMRVINSVVSVLMIPVTAVLINRLNLKYKLLSVFVGTFLIALNWKLIVHAHYLNHDIIITLLILLANLYFFKYLKARHTTNKPELDTTNTILFSIFFGLAVSTKITVLLTLPFYLAMFFHNRDLRNLFASIFVVIGTFIVTNPFAWLFMGDFFSRILEMRVKEAGMVFDSVDYGPFKYIFTMFKIVTPPVFILSVLGMLRIKAEKDKAVKQFLVLLIAQIITYLIFFSLQARRVDRWMLPIVPNMILFVPFGFEYLSTALKKTASKYLLYPSVALSVVIYLFYPAVLLTQFQRNTPKSASYIWAKDHLPATSTKFGITEEGLDPLNKLPLSTIWQYNSYESSGAQFMLPPDPLLYDYIFVSSRPLSWTSNPEVVKKYPYYSQRWGEFTHILNESGKFELVNSWEIANPNLIPLSSVYIYKNTTGNLLE